MKKLPIGIQDFEEIVTQNYIYIDKTEYIYKLITEGKVYFLSRPRRFGKSLLVSALENIFKGKKELFKDLYIYDKLEWKEYPVIKIDLSLLFYEKPEDLKESFLNVVREIGGSNGLKLNAKNYKDGFKELIKKLSEKGRVVILIDEYDKPIIDFITEPDINKINRDTLKNFYGILKGLDEYIKFVFITGVSKFSRTSIFSELNNLNDISMIEKFNSILGYKEEDLPTYFKEHIINLADKKKKTELEIYEQIRTWYNGYSWGSSEKVYNPFSVLNLLGHLDFNNYWFTSGTPTFLIDLIKERNYKLPKLEKLIMTERSFGTYEVEKIRLEALLFQTGYLTIKKVIQEDVEKYYELYFPNLEVKHSLLKCLFNEYIGRDNNDADIIILKLSKYLEECRIDKFFNAMQSLFAGIPYEIFINKEDYYNSLVYMILSLAGISGNFELMTNIGRLDCAIEMEHIVYIFEFKLNASAEEGIRQIKDKKYYQKYQNKDKKIHIIGVELNQEERNIQEWKIEII